MFQDLFNFFQNSGLGEFFKTTGFVDITWQMATMWAIDAARLAWLSGTCFGREVVPEVCSTSAMSSGAGVGGSSASTGGSRYTMDTVTGSDTAYDRVANYLDSLSYQMLMTILIVAVLTAVISLLWSIFGAAPLEVGRDR